MAHVMSRELASKTVKYYVCAACWGHLIEFFDGDETRVECPNCGEDTPGFVTKYFAERRRSESHGELMDVYEIIPDLNPHHGKGEEQLLKEMGF